MKIIKQQLKNTKHIQACANKVSETKTIMCCVAAAKELSFFVLEGGVVKKGMVGIFY